MRKKVEQFCSRQGLLPMGAKVLVACSGGADSLALLDILWRLAPRHEWQIAAAHYEHGIRGEVSLADARFVADFCQQRQIPCYAAHGDVPREAVKLGMTLEQAARYLRYAFLKRIRREQGFDYIAVAHHADDQAETVLMRILRGTGITGLGAMRPQSGRDGHIVRPLLGLCKQDLLDYCHQEHLLYREDATNFQADCTRNRLRLELLPQLQREYNPEISRALCQLAEVAAEEEDFLQEEVARYHADEGYVRQEDGAIVQAAVAKLHPALQRGLIRRLWKRVTGSGLDLGYQQTERVRSLLLQGATGSQQELSHCYTARITYGYLVMDKTVDRRETSGKNGLQAMAIKIPGSMDWGGFHVMTAWQAEMDREVKTSSQELYLYPENFDEPLVLRFRRPGDFMVLPGGSKKIKKIMIDDKIPQGMRDTLPLLAAGSEIIWMIGRRRSARCLQGHADYHRILYLRIEERGFKHVT
ncbi:MAG: tRNA lysidine(34) synthetase TilS [Selenomonas sp.]|uniref:tRNA lysidine(34) synthetase TilS n=1 Tax=Selenomonas sp. TaxID=2053611 RepID=UPI0025E43A32|nr:tRNA lysidine(34) synthetase TilS [Selenomonas sp.]MCR5756880.1 tRNA lysidine(34) synthetase TilS [Selenomonas sp.]